MQDPQSLHKYLYVHGDPIQGIIPTGESLIGSIGGFMGSMAMNLGRVGAVVTIGSALAGAGVYRFYSKGSAVRGALVGAQIGCHRTGSSM